MSERSSNTYVTFTFSMFHSIISKYFRKVKVHTHLEKKEIVRLISRADRTLPSFYIETLHRAQKLQGDTGNTLFDLRAT